MAKTSIEFYFSLNKGIQRVCGKSSNPLCRSHLNLGKRIVGSELKSFFGRITPLDSPMRNLTTDSNKGKKTVSKRESSWPFKDKVQPAGSTATLASRNTWPPVMLHAVCLGALFSEQNL